MTLNEAKTQARLIFKSDLDFENKGQIKYIYRKPAEGEEITPTEADRVKCRDGEKRLIDGRLLLGGGTSWLSALRQAAKVRLEGMQADEAKRKAEKKEFEQAAQVRINKFMDFLMEKFEKEFEASLGTATETTAPNTDVPQGDPGRP